MEKSKFDPVERPEHYCRNGIECIDAMIILFGHDATIQFCKLSAFKYRWRAGLKGDREQDEEKAEWYLQKTVELAERQDNAVHS